MEVQVWTVASLVSIPHMEMQHMEMQVEMQVEVFRKPDGIKFSKSSSETKAVKKIQREVENGGVQLHDFRNENSASLRRITPSTQVGRLSESHSDIGLQLTQFPEKMAMEPKGEESEHLKVF